MRRRERPRNGERGVVATELAIVLPLLLLIVGTSIVFVRGYSADLRLTKAVGIAARLCALEGNLAAVRACATARLTREAIAGCENVQADVEREELLTPYENELTGEAEISVVPQFRIRGSCDYQLAGAFFRGAPPLNLRAAARMTQN